MSALCSVAVLSKNGQSHIANQMQLAEPMMVVFDNYAITEWETALVDPRLQALILDANSLTLAQLQSLQDAYLSENWRSELSVFLWDYQQKKNERFHLWPVLTYAKNATDLLLAQVCSHLQAKAATPFFSALKSYLSKHADSWHTPGHSNGDSLRQSAWGSDFYHFVGQSMWQADLSVSVLALDSLLHPEGVIQEAQDLAAQAFGAQHTYFATNGSSTANKVILQSLLTPGNVLLLDRNCHKSVHHGVILSGAKPVYLDSAINNALGLFAPVPLQSILQAIQTHPNAKALILTSSTYDGLCYDLQPIIQAAHARGIKVIIDEAWYGFARFHPTFRPTALECGADYVTQSTHKTMSAFSQASMVHVNDPDFDPHLLRETFNMHASTSPQYSILASLDVARQQMVMEGYGLLSRALQLVQVLHERINQTGVFRVLQLEDLLPESLTQDGIRLDPTKITIDTRLSGYSGDHIQDILFERFHIQVEKSTFATISLLVTIGTTAEKTMRLIHALNTLAQEAPKKKKLKKKWQKWDLQVPHFSQLACLPRDAFYCDGERLPLIKDKKAHQQLIGKVCCDQIVPYPPGIPVLVPGQIITAEIVKYLANILSQDKPIETHGLIGHGKHAHIRVLTEAEQLALQT
ncbi:aminotransferase class I/II-fold pyridoxal phosphate-dependent enzyme [Vitreoscilla stercoraria]|uniref:Aminotransferase class I/II-fold pyridoxal phosphate-dependent enzyme n=1 Tax=Vitreoscilla stercoraria TaxID=61 RepID=A0ABY4EAK5_VITST|nr:aminotransferase class I/II-fold pyridoxal phosphate-dependent enzyme [Vitreoscilla stercoraria]UOO91578.1 aminotransferase class I/II-fold pyridoxal phosphate-dependent enzyme [Vitreoscilla stercoraria]